MIEISIVIFTMVMDRPHPLTHVPPSRCSDHARLLWQRIPQAVREGNAELAALWEVGKRLWRREFAAVYEAAEKQAWPPHLASLVPVIIGEPQASN